MSDDLRQGKRLLRELLPWARAELAKEHDYAEAETRLGEATLSYVTEDNLAALMIVRAPKGGWYADLVLKSVPPGVPNVIGTPVDTPLRTRAEAEERAKRTLVMALVVARRNAETKPQALPPVFTLCGWAIKLSPVVLPTALKLMPEGAAGYGTPLQAAGRVEATLDQLCPEGFDGEAFNTWPREKQARLVGVLHVAALSGLYVFPMRQHKAPEGGA